MELKTVKFLAAFGDQDKEVELGYIKGGYFQIMIGDRYYGQIIKTYGEVWRVCPQKDHYFTTDDKDAMLERLGLL
jgi:hypothetical protein